MGTWVITGGAGFIGSALIRLLLRESDHRIVNLDKLTYAGNLESLPGTENDPRYSFERMDVCNGTAVQNCLVRYAPDMVIHLAAESHVDRSIDGPAQFVETNLVGTFTMLEQSLRFWRSLDPIARGRFRFVHVSTDEVFGSLGPQGRFTEDSPYTPNSPYSATKAGADHLVRAWHHTFGLPTMTTNCSNNYGPYQFPEKLIPLIIQNALAKRPLPVYGKGENVRDWLFVEDHVRALRLVAERGIPGETYNIGGNNELKNIDVVKRICGLLDELANQAGQSEGPLSRHSDLITFVADRPGHDARYAIDATKITRDLGWSPRETFDTGLRKTVQWYLANENWTSRVQSGAYRVERLGLNATP